MADRAVHAGLPAAAMTAGGKGRLLFALCLISVLGGTDRVALSILVEPIRTELLLTDSELGLLTGAAFSLAYASLGIPLARVADRGSRVWLLSGCLAVWSLMTAATGLAHSFLQLFLGRVGTGFGEAGLAPAQHSLIGDTFAPRQRTLAISIVQVGVMVGLSGGLLVVGLLERYYGWRGALFIVGLAGLPLALLCSLALPEPQRPARGGTASRETAFAAIRGLMGRPAFRQLMFAYALSAGCVVGINQWIPAFLMRSFGLAIAQVGACEGAATLVAGICGLLAGGYAASHLLARDSRWELWLPAAGFGACGPLFAVAFLSQSPLLAIAIKSLGGFLAGLGGGAALSAIQAFAEPHRRGIAVSLVLFVSSLLGQGLTPFLVGALSDALAPALRTESLRYALLISTLVLPWSSLHFMLAARRLPLDRV